MAKTRIVGTLTGVFDGTLDGIAARLVRPTCVGYTVELLESKPPFRQGDTVHLSPAEFLAEAQGELRRLLPWALRPPIG